MGPSCPGKDEATEGQFAVGPAVAESAVAGTTGDESAVAGLPVGRNMTIIWNSENH